MKDVEVLEERTLLPGLTFGCSQSEETRFVPWEKRERKGALKAMFSWKQHSEKLKEKEPTKEESDASRSSGKEENSAKDSAKKSTVIWNCEENIDQSIYRVLTKGGGKRSKGKGKKVSQDERWKGCKEQPSEIPVPRKTKKKQVTFSHHTLSILL